MSRNFPVGDLYRRHKWIQKGSKGEVTKRQRRQSANGEEYYYKVTIKWHNKGRVTMTVNNNISTMENDGRQLFGIADQSTHQQVAAPWRSKRTKYYKKAENPNIEHSKGKKRGGTNRNIMTKNEGEQKLNERILDLYNEINKSDWSMEAKNRKYQEAQDLEQKWGELKNSTPATVAS